MNSMDKKRVAVVQAAPVAFDLPATLDRFEEHCREAKAKDAELIVFPEAFLGGYPKGADFGVRVGSRSAEGRRLFQRYMEGAIEIPSTDLEHITDLVKELDVTVVVGAIERHGGTLYCSALTLSEAGLLHVHRKVMPTAMERVIWGQGDGSSVRGVETPAGRLGAAICWENYMPLLRMALYRDQVELYCAPTVDDRENWVTSMRHIAYEGRLFVLSACQYATRADYPEDFSTSTSDPQAALIRGGSCIVDPFGELLAGPIYDETAILIAELDMGLIAQGKFDLDVAGHYSCPGLDRVFQPNS